MRKLLLTAGVALAASSVMAQQSNTMYFMKHSPVRHALNPSFMPEGYKVYVGIPGISSIDFGVGNNSYVFRDIANVGADGKIHTIFDEDGQLGISGLLDEAHRNVKTHFNTEVSIINFGFRTKRDHFYSFDISTKAESHVMVPTNILHDIFETQSPADLLGTHDFGKFGLNTIAYTEFALGFAKEFDKLSLGAKVKYLLGHTAIKTDFSDVTLKLDYDEWYLKGHGSVYGAVPGLELQDKDGDPTKGLDVDFNNDLDWKNSIRQGSGAAIDLGATYKMLDDRLTLSASVLDLGFIHWSNNINKISLDADYEFNPTNMLEDESPYDVLDRLKKEFEGYDANSLYHVDEKAEAFNTILSTKILVGGEYAFWKDRVSVGLLSKTYFNPYGTREELTVSGNFRPHRFFDFTVSYDLVDGRAHNLGAGVNINLGPINIYGMVDQIPLAWSKVTKDGYKIPTHTSETHVSLGMNLLFGWSTRKTRDTDGDGVPDRKDKCPNTPAEALGYVDSLTGCPLDTDGDGVPDYLDKCPGTPAAAYGSVDTCGCPLDSDQDGIADYIDMCPGTPAGAKGYVDAKGCLLDTDYDGVPDYMDKCPDSPRQAVGHVDSTGCPLDTDGDGVPDYLDQCPSTPAEVGKAVDEKGCTLDTDGDGVPDYKDKCPTVKGVESNDGCPEVKASVTKLFKKALNGIQFETGKAVIKTSSNAILNQIVTVMKENPTYKLKINGHTDNTGDYNKNKDLSQRRADAVRDYLVKKGVSASRLSTEGFGSDVPVADNTTAAGRTLNRRVEFIVEFMQTVTE